MAKGSKKDSKKTKQQEALDEEDVDLDLDLDLDLKIPVLMILYMMIPVLVILEPIQGLVSLLAQPCC